MRLTGEDLVHRARAARRRLRDGRFVFAADIPSAVSEAECGRLARLARGQRVLEVGAYFGRSTIALASTAAVVHSVDFHPPAPDGGLETTFLRFISNLDRYDLRHKVVVHLGFSQETLPALRKDWFDLAFIDAQHQRAAVEDDLELVLPHLRPGAALAFHDYGLTGTEHDGEWHDFQVTEVVDELAARLNVKVDVVERLAVIHLPR